MNSHSQRETHTKWKKEGANEGVGKQMGKKKYKGDGGFGGFKGRLW